MTTPRDRQRIAAYRAWLDHVGGIDAAHAATGIAIRSLQRMRSGAQPPPARLLDELAAGVGTEDLARQLADAARPDGRHAGERAHA